MMDSASVSASPEAILEPGTGLVQGGIEVARAGLRADCGSSGFAGQFDALTRIRLSRIALVQQFDIDSDQLVVVALDSAQSFTDVGTEVLRNLDISAADNDFHANSHRSYGYGPDQHVLDGITTSPHPDLTVGTAER